MDDFRNKLSDLLHSLGIAAIPFLVVGLGFWLVTKTNDSNTPSLADNNNAELASTPTDSTISNEGEQTALVTNPDNANTIVDNSNTGEDGLNHPIPVPVQDKQVKEGCSNYNTGHNKGVVKPRPTPPKVRPPKYPKPKLPRIKPPRIRPRVPRF